MRATSFYACLQFFMCQRFFFAGLHIFGFPAVVLFACHQYFLLGMPLVVSFLRASNVLRASHSYFCVPPVVFYLTTVVFYEATDVLYVPPVSFACHQFICMAQLSFAFLQLFYFSASSCFICVPKVFALPASFFTLRPLIFCAPQIVFLHASRRFSLPHFFRARSSSVCVPPLLFLMYGIF